MIDYSSIIKDGHITIRKENISINRLYKIIDKWKYTIDSNGYIPFIKSAKNLYQINEDTEVYPLLHSRSWHIYDCSVFDSRPIIIMSGRERYTNTFKNNFIYGTETGYSIDKAMIFGLSLISIGGVEGADNEIIALDGKSSIGNTKTPIILCLIDTKKINRLDIEIPHNNYTRPHYKIPVDILKFVINKNFQTKRSIAEIISRRYADRYATDLGFIKSHFKYEVLEERDIFNRYIDNRFDLPIRTNSFSQLNNIVEKTKNVMLQEAPTQW